MLIRSQLSFKSRFITWRHTHRPRYCPHTFHPKSQSHIWGFHIKRFLSVWFPILWHSKYWRRSTEQVSSSPSPASKGWSQSMGAPRIASNPLYVNTIITCPICHPIDHFNNSSDAPHFRCFNRDFLCPVMWCKWNKNILCIWTSFSNRCCPKIIFTCHHVRAVSLWRLESNCHWMGNLIQEVQ